MLLGIAPIAALPLMAGGLQAGFRDQVLRLATGNSPAAAAHRAAVAKTPYSFGHHGFPRPIHQPGPPWLHPGAGPRRRGGRHRRRGRGGPSPGSPCQPHPGVPPAGAATPGVSGSAGPALGHDAQPGTPRARATAQTNVLADGQRAADGQRQCRCGTPDREVTGAPSSAGASSAAAGPSASASTRTSATPGAGTLSVSPATLTVAPPASGSITLTASGGAVNWSISEPPGLEKKVVVAPMSGTAGGGPDRHGHRYRAGHGQAAGAPHVHPGRRDRDGGDQLSWALGYGLRPSPP